MSHRYFGRVVHVTGAGGVVVDRLDGLGRVYVLSREALADAALGDRIEFSVRPGGEGHYADRLNGCRNRKGKL
jgi:hypothetical protein